MVIDISVEGVCAASGNEFVVVHLHGAVRKEDRTGWVPRGSFVGGVRDALMALKDQGVMIIGPEAEKKLWQLAQSLQDFRPDMAVEHIGWNAGIFALPDGTLFCPKAGPAPIVTFRPVPNKCSVAGSFTAWRDGVAALLEGQHLGVFGLSATFVSTILRFTTRVGNFGFELLGDPGVGKSTLEYLCSSVLGGPTKGEDGHYWVSLDTTINALEDTMHAHRDLPIIFDEVNLLVGGAPKKVRADVYQAFAFKLSAGEDKDRKGTAKRPPSKLVFIVTSNESIADMAGDPSKGMRAAEDRLITIPVPNRPYKTFDHLPPGYAGSTEYAKALERAAEKHHGHPIRRFLKRLVQARAKDEPALRAWIAARVAHFVKKAMVDANDGSAYRVAEAFALVYAAGKLAQRYRVLPQNLNILAAALSCHKLHRSTRVLPERFEARLLKLADSDATIIVDDARAKRSKAELKVIEGALAVRHCLPSGDRLLVNPKRVKEAFPDWDLLKKLPDVIGLLELEPSKDEIKRTKHLARAKGLPRGRQLIFKLPHVTSKAMLIDG